MVAYQPTNHLQGGLPRVCCPLLDVAWGKPQCQCTPKMIMITIRIYSGLFISCDINRILSLISPIYLELLISRHIILYSPYTLLNQVRSSTHPLIVSTPPFPGRSTTIISAQASKSLGSARSNMSSLGVPMVPSGTNPPTNWE